MTGKERRDAMDRHAAAWENLRGGLDEAGNDIGPDDPDVEDENAEDEDEQ